jgi:hypothetical protein
MRLPFNPSDYEQPFLDIMEEFHGTMVHHHGRCCVITYQDNTVEIPYLFPPPNHRNHSSQDLRVILHLLHDDNGKFVSHSLETNTSTRIQLKPLFQKLKVIARKHTPPPPPNPIPDVLTEIGKALDNLNCENVGSRKIDVGVVQFFGMFGIEIKFIFNVNVDSRGRLNTKPLKRDGGRRERVYPVWQVPISPPSILKNKIDEVICWVKEVEAGRTPSNRSRTGWHK